MLKNLFFLQYGYGAQFELEQSLCEGKKVEKYRETAKYIDAIPLDDDVRSKLMYAFWDKLATISPSQEFLKNEPSDYDSIISLCENKFSLDKHNLTVDTLFDKVYGGWMGRVIGCMFGKPVEGLKRDKIIEILKKLNNYPMVDYLKTGSDRDFCKKHDVNFEALVENYGYAVADDDTNYTILGLGVLEECGNDFTTEDVAEAWIKRLPAISCCTAEFCAYRNILNKVFPPLSATYRNPFREWIGAQIRADIYGYVTPLDPLKGAHFAFKDARLSHTANGVYGAMFVAGMISSAYANVTVEEIINNGLNCIPKTSRLHQKIVEVIKDYKNGKSFEDFVNNFHATYNEHDMSHSVHVIPNAVIVVACLLYFQNDFSRAIGSAVEFGFDTDCNAATVGSVLGVLIGEKAIPQYLKTPLNGTLESDIKGNYKSKIEDLAKRTLKVIDNFS